MSTTGKIRVKYISEKSRYGFVYGEIYDGYKIKGAVPQKEKIISVIDKFGEEYAYPKEWFEIVEE